METREQIEKRVERVQIETDKHRIVGSVTLPREGYQSRFSDALNRTDVAFIPVVDAEIRPLEGGEPQRRDMVIVGKQHIRLSFPIEEVG
jgi:hypothetical protein